MPKIVLFNADAPCLQPKPRPSDNFFDATAQLLFVGIGTEKVIQSIRVRASDGFTMYERNFSGRTSLLAWLNPDSASGTVGEIYETVDTVMNGGAVRLPNLYDEETLQADGFTKMLPQ